MIECFVCRTLGVGVAFPPATADVVLVEVVSESGTLPWLALFLFRRVNPTPRPTPRATATKKKMRIATRLRESNFLREFRPDLAFSDSDFSELFSD